MSFGFIMVLDTGFNLRKLISSWSFLYLVGIKALKILTSKKLKNLRNN